MRYLSINQKPIIADSVTDFPRALFELHSIMRKSGRGLGPRMPRTLDGRLNVIYFISISCGRKTFNAESHFKERNLYFLGSFIFSQLTILNS